MSLLKILTGILAAFGGRAEGTHGSGGGRNASATDDDICRAPYSLRDEYETIRVMPRPIHSEALQRLKERLERDARENER